jgi:sodium-dependent dicarboxylate transporter 2/3/5
MRLLLGVAYAASIGGIGTPIGTPPNLLFLAEYEKLGNEAWSFTQWMKIGVPVVLLLLPLAFFRLASGVSPTRVLPIAVQGPMSVRERRVLIIFGLTALLWMTRVEPFGGWSSVVGGDGASDATVAFVGLIALLLLPDGKGSRLLSWSEAEKIPWGILLLFGGGIALAAGFQESGLSASLGQGLSRLTAAPEVVLILGICLSVTFLTEVTSNTATTALLMPILAATAQAAGIAPEKLMVPAALSASCAFMLPVATAPNAIIFGSGHVPTSFMARQGFVLNLLGAVLITAVCTLLL